MTAPMTNQRFARLLEAYGANLDRWPQIDRAAAEAALRSNPDLAVLTRQAEEFDKQLARLASPEAMVTPDPRLVDRIITAAGITEPATQHSHSLSNVTEFQPRRARSTLNPPPRWRVAREQAVTGALMAASLVVGIFVGAAGLAQPAAMTITQLTQPSIERTVLTETAIHTTSLDEALTADDEEYL